MSERLTDKGERTSVGREIRESRLCVISTLFVCCKFTFH